MSCRGVDIVTKRFELRHVYCIAVGGTGCNTGNLAILAVCSITDRQRCKSAGGGIDGGRVRAYRNIARAPCRPVGYRLRAQGNRAIYSCSRSGTQCDCVIRCHHVIGICAKRDVSRTARSRTGIGTYKGILRPGSPHTCGETKCKIVIAR